ncbi:MAG: hypothetical protein CMI36_11150, partial [Owenweeksia sp.]|nr:hypothetical protein [Owenweeksia sp.]
MTTDSFAYRHIGPRPHEVKEMLDTIGVSSLDELIDQTIPKGIRLKKPLQLSDPMGENEFINRIRDLGRKNKVFKTYIGLG